MRFPRILTVLFCVVVLAACSTTQKESSSQTKAPDQNGELVFLDASPNDSLDPTTLVNENSFSQATLFAIYERLLAYTPEGELAPGLLTKWGFTDEDLKVFEMTVRPNVVFHDGEKLTPDVVKKNFERTQSLGDKAAPQTREVAQNIASITTSGRDKVIVKLKKPAGGFAYALAAQFGMMISPNSLDGSLSVDLKPVGAGPYEVVSFSPNRVTKMKRFDDFWDTSKTETRPASFEVRYVADEQTRLNSLRAGEGTVSLISPRQISAAKSSGLDIKVNETLSVFDMYVNTTGPLKDVKVRQALMYGIDREAISKGLTFDTGIPTQQLFPPNYSIYSSEMANRYDFDPAKAKELLKEAGHADGVTLDFMLLNTPEYTQMAEALQQQLKKSDISLKFHTIEIAQAGIFINGEKGDLMLAKWGGRADPLQTLSIVVGPNGSYVENVGGSVSTRLSELLGDAEGFEVGDPKRVELIKAANEEALEQAAYFPVVTRSNIFAFEPGCIGNLKPYISSGSTDWRNVTVGKGC